MPTTELLWLLLPWSLAFVFLGRPRACPALTDPMPEVRISVIIPARDEQERLPPLLDSLRAQDYPNFETILVDDHSTDGTAALARAAGVTTISLTEVPDGWLGKPHACWTGAQRASGDLLVFLDADTVLEPSGLRRLAATHARHGGLVSVQPYHCMSRAYERLSSLFFIIMMGSIRSFTLAGDRLASRGSFGPCMVCAREEYFRAGGHRLVRSEVVDDVTLGRRMQALGVPSRNFIGEGTIGFRMYPGGWRDLADGWTKNFAHGAMTTDPLMLLLITAWISGGAATLDAIAGWPNNGLSNWVIAGLAAYAAYAVQIWWLLRRLGNYGLATAATYPLSLLFFVAVFLRSLYLTLIRRRVHWKGRAIRIGRPRRTKDVR